MVETFQILLCIKEGLSDLVYLFHWSLLGAKVLGLSFNEYTTQSGRTKKALFSVCSVREYGCFPCC